MKTREYEERCSKFLTHLVVDKRRSENTILQYQRALEVFKDYLVENEIEEITKLVVNDYISQMEKQVDDYESFKKKPKIINGKRPVTKLSTVKMRVRTLNALFDYADQKELKSKVQVEKDETENVNEDTLSDVEFLKILDFTEKHSNKKMKLIIETLAYTGIRVSELQFITVESLKNRKPRIKNKGKIRYGFIPKRLNNKLKAYCKENGINKGIIFRSRPLTDKDGNFINEDQERVDEPVYKLISQSYIRDEMKRIAGKARMKRSKVHPHNFRHFYAQRYANMPNNNPYILPMLLGHSQTGTNNSVTALYVKPESKDLLKIVDLLEAHINDRLEEAKIKRDKNKRLAERKKKRNQKKK